jgi:hypothetical protein
MSSPCLKKVQIKTQFTWEYMNPYLSAVALSKIRLTLVAAGKKASTTNLK